MQNKKRNVLIAAVATLIVISTVSASIMVGCGNDSDSTPDTAVIVETKLVSKIVDDTYYIDSEGNTIAIENGTDAKGNIVVQNGTDANGNEVKTENGTDPQGNKVIEIKTDGNGKVVVEDSEAVDSKSVQETKKVESSKSETKADTQKTTQSAKSETTAKSDSSESKNNSGTLTIGNKSFSVGDTITCTYELTTPEVLENFQGYVSYDSSYLSVEDAVLEGPAENGSYINFKVNVKDKIRFNGSSIKTGYDYKSSKAFLTVTYKVKASGSTEPSFTFEEVTGMSQKSYVTDDKTSDEIKLSVSYS